MDAFMPAILLLGVACIPLIIFAPLLTLRLSEELRWAQPVRVILLSLSFAGLGLIMFVCDEMSAATESWIFCAIVLVMGVGISVATFRRHRRIGRCFGAFFAASIILWHFSDLTPVKPFRRFFAAIHEGMTSSEVTAALHREFPPGGRFPLPVERTVAPEHEMTFILDPTQAAYDVEGVFVTLREGKVVAKYYNAD